MKVRKGFVANSSSSSYVCEVCNNVIEVFDGDYKSSGIVFCENEHVLEEHHLKDDVEIVTTLDRDESLKAVLKTIENLEKNKKTYAEQTWYKNYLKKGKELLDEIHKVDDKDWDNLFYYEVADFIDWDYEPTVKEKDCPLCTLELIKEQTKVKCLLKMMGITNEELEGKIKENFPRLKDVENFVE